MSSAEKQIRDRVESFVRELEGLIRQAALEAVAEALGVGAAGQLAPQAARSSKKGSSAVRGSGDRGAAKRAIDEARPRAAPKGRASSGKRARRSADELEALGNAIVEYVSKNPGQRAEQIKKALGLGPSEWALPVKKLVDDGQLLTEGEKRATTYRARGRLGES